MEKLEKVLTEALILIWQDGSKQEIQNLIEQALKLLEEEVQDELV